MSLLSQKMRKRIETSNIKRSIRMKIRPSYSPILNLQTFYMLDVFAVLAARISSTISSAERLSFHTPAKRLAQPLRGLAAGDSGRVMELLSKVMSSNFTLSLRSFSSDQYLALSGDGVANTFVFICFCFYMLDAAKININSEITK